MNVEFHPEAAEEFEAAVDWYEEREAGLGLDFAVEVNAAIRQCSPHVGQPLSLWGSIRIRGYALARVGRDALATRIGVLEDTQERIASGI